MRADNRALARVARRSIRKAPLRSLLIVLLIAVLVATGTGFAIAMRSTTTTTADQSTAIFGGSNAVLTFGPGLYDSTPHLVPSTYTDGVAVQGDGNTTQEEMAQAIAREKERLAAAVVWLDDTDQQQLQAQAASALGDADVVISRRAWIGVDSPYGPFQRGTPLGRVSDLPVDNPLTDGLVEFVDGRAPQTDQEIAVHHAWLDGQTSQVGDTIQVNGVDFGVVGTVVSPASKWSPLSLLTPAGFDRLDPNPNVLQFRMRTNLSVVQQDILQSLKAVELALDQPIAAQLTNWQANRLANGEWTFWPGSTVAPADDALAVRVLPTLVSGALGLQLALVAVAAFAVGVRRRTRDFAQLATTGADAGQLKRLVLFEAGWLGLVGAAIGVVVGIAAMYAIAGWGVFGDVGNRYFTRVRLDPSDWIGPAVVGVGSALVAAWWPARTVGKADLTSSLGSGAPRARTANRREHRTPLLILGGVGALGFAVTVVRSLLGLGVTDGIYPQIVAVSGATLVLAPFYLINEIVRSVGQRADSLPLLARLVARMSDRHGGRSWIVIGSFAIMLAGPVLVGATVKAFPESVARPVSDFDERAVLLTTPYPAQAVGAQLTTEGQATRVQGFALQLLPELQKQGLTPAGFSQVEVLDSVSLIARDAITGLERGGGQTWVASPEMFAALNIDPEIAAALDQDTVMALGGDINSFGSDGGYFLKTWNQESASAVPVDVIRGPRLQQYKNLVLVSPDLAAQLNLTPQQAGALYVYDTPLAADQELQLFDAANIAWTNEFGELTYDKSINEQIGNFTWRLISLELEVQRFERSGLSQDQFTWLSLGLASVLAALVAYTTASLSAVEVDEEIATMIATGAAPSIRRRLLATQTLYQLAIAALVAVPATLLVFYLATRLHTGSNPPGFIVPWISVGVGAIAVPLLVAAAVGLTFRNGKPAVSRRLS